METLCSLLSVPPTQTFLNNFVNIRDSGDRQTALDNVMRLYSRADSDNTNTLTSSFLLQTSASIDGVYVCRAQDDFGSRNTSVNITVKGLCNLHGYYYCIYIAIKKIMLMQYSKYALRIIVLPVSI